VDEEVHRLHGRYGVDYPEHTYFERERPVVQAIRQRFVKELEAGNDVVLDHGLWRRAERDAWQQAAREAGGQPLIVYLPADRDELLRRLAERNERGDANALTVTPEALDDFFARFDLPADDEEVIVYTGDLDGLLTALSAAERRPD
jgi:predicted kinase